MARMLGMGGPDPWIRGLASVVVAHHSQYHLPQHLKFVFQDLEKFKKRGLLRLCRPLWVPVPNENLIGLLLLAGLDALK